MGDRTDICLVSMPYESPEYPALGVGLLLAGLKAAGFSAKAVYPRLWFAEQIGLGSYLAIARLGSSERLLADWTFAGSLFPEFSPDHEPYLDRLFGETPFLLETYRQMLGPDVDVRERLLAVRRAATAFIAEAAERILALRPRLVGCSSTFDQNVASLALLRQIKKMEPGVITVLGGADAEGGMGRARKEIFPWLDEVVSGEADARLPELCRALLAGGPGDNAGPAAPALVRELDSLPIPDYSDYFAALESSALRDDIHPLPALETARGCWWGKCTFCGMDREKFVYRAKSADRVMAEMDTLYQRHAVPRFLIADNILNPAYFKTLLPQLAARAGSPYRMFWEVKSNLTEEQVKLLAAAGVGLVQPGIESLHDGFLGLLQKGAAAIANVALLKYAMEDGIIVLWNLLCDIPGEQDGWYDEMSRWLPLLGHLQPPRGVSPVSFTRFSDYHEQPDRFGLRLEPVDDYAAIYPLPADQVARLAYYFTDRNRAARPAPAPGKERLKAAVREWVRLFTLYPDADRRVGLTVKENEHESVVTDTRPGAEEKHFVLTGLHHLAGRASHQPIGRDALVETICTAAGAGSDAAGSAVDELIDRKIILALGGRLLNLALREPVTGLPRKRDFLAGCVIGGRLYQ